jgi:hypothetical protein
MLVAVMSGLNDGIFAISPPLRSSGGCKNRTMGAIAQSRLMRLGNESLQGAHSDLFGKVRKEPGNSGSICWIIEFLKPNPYVPLDRK